MAGVVRVIFRELLDITRYVYFILIKPIIICSVIVLPLYFGYTSIVCRYMWFLPYVCTFCPTEPLGSISLPPLDQLANNSISIADALANADVSAPIRCVQAKTALIELRAKILYSDIDSNVRHKLDEEMQKLGNLIEIAGDDLTDTLASFHGAIDRLGLYIQFALDDLSKVINKENQHKSHVLQIGHSTQETEMAISTSFDRYMMSMNKEVDDVLVQAQKAHLSLKQIEEKLKTLQELNHQGKSISQKRLDELQHGSFWSRLFDEGQLGIVKHQRNINTLDDFVSYIRVTSNNIGEIIVKLRSFKKDATNLKTTTAILAEYPAKSINEHTKLLEAAFNRLADSKSRFEGKMEQTKRDKQIS